MHFLMELLHYLQRNRSDPRFLKKVAWLFDLIRNSKINRTYFNMSRSEYELRTLGTEEYLYSKAETSITEYSTLAFFLICSKKAYSPGSSRRNFKNGPFYDILKS